MMLEAFIVTGITATLIATIFATFRYFKRNGVNGFKSPEQKRHEDMVVLFNRFHTDFEVYHQEIKDSLQAVGKRVEDIWDRG